MESSILSSRFPTNWRNIQVPQLLEIGDAVSAINFQRYFVRTMSCYTLLRGFRPPWPPFVCQNEATAFVVSFSACFGTLFECSVHPALPILLTRIWPTKKILFTFLDSIKQSKNSATFKVRDESEEIIPPWSKNVALPRQTINIFQLSWGKFRKKPATRRLDESFAAILKYLHRFARQNALRPPPQFLMASSLPRIVRCLSGPYKPTKRFLIHPNKEILKTLNCKSPKTPSFKKIRFHFN